MHPTPQYEVVIDTNNIDIPIVELTPYSRETRELAAATNSIRDELNTIKV